MVRWMGFVALVCGVALAACGEEKGEDPPKLVTGGEGGGEGGGTGEGGAGGEGGEGGEGGAGGSGGSGGSGGTGGSGPKVWRITPRLAGIVDAEAEAAVRNLLQGVQGSNLIEPLHLFYEAFPDEYDFVFFFTESEQGAYGTHTTVNRPAIPGTGIERDFFDSRSPSQKVRSAIALRLGNNGPTLHEVAHHWAVHLSTDLGFERSHWGYSGVYGQLGGFDPDTLRCESPAGAEPPDCDPDPEGGTTYILDWFAPNANGGDSIPYAPLELYLMGLIPADEVPDIPIFENVLDSYTLPGDEPRRAVRAESIRTVTIEEIIEVHGPREMATEEERSFRAAFVLVTAEEPTQAQIDMADNWVAIFGCHDPERWLLCFEDATDGLATMSVDLPEVP